MRQITHEIAHTEISISSIKAQYGVVNSNGVLYNASEQNVNLMQNVFSKLFTTGDQLPHYQIGKENNHESIEYFPMHQ